MNISKVHMNILSGYGGWEQLAGAECNYVKLKRRLPAGEFIELISLASQCESSQLTHATIQYIAQARYQNQRPTILHRGDRLL